MPATPAPITTIEQLQVLAEGGESTVKLIDHSGTERLIKP
jgi:hypothetical protein